MALKLASLLTLSLLFLSACGGAKEDAHTTATTYVEPPPRQVLTVVPAPTKQSPADSGAPVKVISPSGNEQYLDVDPTKPLLVLNAPKEKVFRLGEVIVIDFVVHNAKLRADGGDFRLRYIVDDEDAQWIDSPQHFGLSGWVPGKHTIRLELIGPDGWPYRNGNQNIVMREINVADK